MPPVSLVQLESLDLQDNWLVELPEDYLSPLAWLNVSDNFLQDLPNPLYSTLKRLMVNHNPLGRLPATLPAPLEWLEARQCQLREIPQLAPALLYLDVSDNAITSPPFHWPRSLIALLASNNLLDDLGELPDSLTQLVVDNNRLTHFLEPLAESLEMVDISKNLIVNISSQILPSLRKLRADHNLIQVLPEYLCDPKCKIQLWLRNNPLSAETQSAIASANRISVKFIGNLRIIY